MTSLQIAEVPLCGSCSTIPGISSHLLTMHKVSAVPLGNQAQVANSAAYTGFARCQLRSNAACTPSRHACMDDGFSCAASLWLLACSRSRCSRVRCVLEMPRQEAAGHPLGPTEHAAFAHIASVGSSYSETSKPRTRVLAARLLPAGCRFST